MAFGLKGTRGRRPSSDTPVHTRQLPVAFWRVLCSLDRLAWLRFQAV